MSHSAAEIYTLGTEYFDKGDYYNAIYYYDILLMLNPPVQIKAYTYYALGFAYYFVEDYSNAIIMHEHALKLMPNDGRILNNIGNAFWAMNQTATALKYYKMAVEPCNNPVEKGAYNNLGLIYLESKEYEISIKCYIEATQHERNNYIAFYHIGECYRKLKKYAEAVKAYEEAIICNPEFPRPYYGIGSVYYTQRNYDQALYYYNLTIAADINYPLAYYGTGLVYSKLMQWEKSLIEFNKAISLKPTLSSSYISRAIVYYNLHNLTATQKDTNSYLYLAIKEQEIEQLPFILNTLSSYPQNVKTILQSFDIDLSELLSNPFEPIISKIADFSLLLDYYQEAAQIEPRTLLSIQAILYYQLGGPVAAYQLFYEQLDNGTNILTAQEHYYYTLTAIDVNLEQKNIIANNINTLHNTISAQYDSKPLDHYYIAQLYRLQGNTTKAIQHFQQATPLIYAHIMLAHIVESQHEKNKHLAHIHSTGISRLYKQNDIHINYTTNDLSQYQDYLHAHECAEAIAYINDNNTYSIELKYNHLPIWQAFLLAPTTKENLEKEFRKLRAEKKIFLIQALYTEELAKNIPKNTEAASDYLHHQLVEEKTKAIRDEMLAFEHMIAEGSYDIENQIGLTINAWDIGKFELYLYYIQYFYLIRAIDSKQSFTLSIYLIKTLAKQKKKDISKTLEESIYLATDVAKTLLPTSESGLKVVLSMVKYVRTIAKILTKEYIKFDISGKSDYHAFKENLWLHIASEADNLSEQQFMEKYRVFEWFDTFTTSMKPTASGKPLG